MSSVEPAKDPIDEFDQFFKDLQVSKAVKSYSDKKATLFYLFSNKQLGHSY